MVMVITCVSLMLLALSTACVCVWLARRVAPRIMGILVSCLVLLALILEVFVAAVIAAGPQGPISAPPGSGHRDVAAQSHP